MAGAGYGGSSGYNKFSLLAAFQGYVSSAYIRSAAPPPTFVNTAVGGQKSGDMLAGINTQLINPATDGNDIIIQIGINDVGAGITVATYQANMVAILTAVKSARPNTRIHLLSVLWPFSEAWTRTNGVISGPLSAQGLVVQSYNAVLASLPSQFSNARYYDVYTDFYNWAAEANPSNGAQYACFPDGVHPGALGIRVISKSLFRQMVVAKRALPPWMVPVTEADFDEGDWFLSWRRFSQNLRTGGRQPVQALLNRWAGVTVGMNQFPTTAPVPTLTGVADGAVEGGGLLLTPAGLLFFSPTVFQTPLTAPWKLTFQAKFSALAASRTAFVGLSDGANDSLLFGIDNAASSTKFVVRETHGGTSTSTAIAVNADTSDHTIHLQCNGLSNDGAAGPRYNVFVDGTPAFAVYQQVSANFPTTPQAVCAGLCASGGSVLVKRLMYEWFEPDTLTGGP